MHLLEKISKEEQKYQAYLEDCRREDEQLKKDLVDYLQVLPYNKTLEDDLSKLRVPLRAYLKLHFFKGTSPFYSPQRLMLMFILCQIAERIYKRHVCETDKKFC